MAADNVDNRTSAYGACSPSIRRRGTAIVDPKRTFTVRPSLVNNDDFESGRLAVHHLHTGGRRRIVFFSLVLPPSVEDSTVVVHRERGYRSAMKELGLSRAARVVFADQSRASIRKQASTISTNNTPRSGLLLDGFRRFRGFERCQGLGLHVPGDVAIMGHDNTAFAISVSPP